MQADSGKPPVPPDEGNEEEGEEGEDSSFEEQLIDALADIVENGIPVGVSLDDDSLNPIRSIADAVHKNTAAVKEQSKLIEQQNKLFGELVMVARALRP